MGRFIDETDLMDLLHTLDDARHELCYAIKKIPELPTIEAIPKDQYEARLKADMVAMLTEIQLEIQKYGGCSCSCSDGIVDDIDDVIQQKIDALRGKV
jgi:hypothetical protein